ncbi:MAG: hypothetical protein M3270_10555 [Thermoproteota archaeon]|nr:hypothetical protein [Thermoproteota archaeon]
MRQRRKVQILASTRKKQREGITWVADNQEEKANDNNSKGNNPTTIHIITLVNIIAE